MSEERTGWCSGCRLEFSLDDPAVTVVGKVTAKRCTVLYEGKAHSLLLRWPWEKLRKRMALENTGGKRVGEGGYININNTNELHPRDAAGPGDRGNDA